jgi:hypothetical protein
MIRSTSVLPAGRERIALVMEMGVIAEGRAAQTSQGREKKTAGERARGEGDWSSFREKRASEV